MHDEMQQELPGAAERLRAAGLRVTRPRAAVLEALHTSPHVGADELHALLRERTGPVSRQAVYDVLHALSQAGLVRGLLVGGVTRYEVDRQDNHHHLLCDGCGALVDVPCAVGAAPCLTPSHDHGFRVERADVLYAGLCPDCRAADSRDVETLTAPTR